MLDSLRAEQKGRISEHPTLSLQQVSRKISVILSDIMPDVSSSNLDVKCYKVKQGPSMASYKLKTRRTS